MNDLSVQEHEILQLLLKEFTQKEIVNILGTSPGKVQKHLTSIKHKWQVTSTVGIALEAVRRGYVEIEK